MMKFYFVYLISNQKCDLYTGVLNPEIYQLVALFLVVGGNRRVLQLEVGTFWLV